MPSLTTRAIDAMRPGETLWDDLPGFGIRCQSKAKTFILKTRVGGRQKWITIGRHGVLTLKEARDEARVLLGEIARGGNPAKDKADRKKRRTVADLCGAYLKDYAEQHKKASSTYTDRRNIENHVRPLLGREFVADVTVADIDRFKRDVRAGKTAKARPEDQQGGPSVRGGAGVSNRCLALLSRMFTLAERWGWRAAGSNPVRHVDRYRENPREHFLSEAQIAALADALSEAEEVQGRVDMLSARLAQTSEKEQQKAIRKQIMALAPIAESPFFIAFVRLLMLTGARRSEIQTLQWRDVDLKQAILRLPDSKTGAKVIHLSAPAMEVLSKLPQVAKNPYVIAGNRKGAYLVGISKAWDRLRKRAGLPETRLHDIRHTFGAVAAGGGLSLVVIGRLLGHRQPSTTQRYSHVAMDPAKAANEAVGQRIAALMRADAERDAEIIELPTNSKA